MLRKTLIAGFLIILAAPALARGGGGGGGGGDNGAGDDPASVYAIVRVAPVLKLVKPTVTLARIPGHPTYRDESDNSVNCGHGLDFPAQNTLGGCRRQR